MSKLFPPYIEGSLPAIRSNNNIISIPFNHNPSVSIDEIAGYILLIKTVSTSEKILTLSVYNVTNNSNVVNFEDTNNILQNYKGQYLKFQLAYIKKDNMLEIVNEI